MVKIEKNPTTAVMPCPAVLISVYDSNKKANAMTAAWIANICHQPPSVAVAIRPSRYTYELIEQTGCFAVNVPGVDNVRETDYFGIKSGRDEDKFKKTGLTTIVGKKVDVPLINEFPINLECKVTAKHTIGTHDVIIGEILMVHYEEEIIEEGRIDPLKADILAYAAGKYYSLKEKVGTFGFSVKDE
ncbi:MAG: flavin reductase family protein [Candidatus Kariarchaeaceae archaeon]